MPTFRTKIVTSSQKILKRNGNRLCAISVHGERSLYQYMLNRRSDKTQGDTTIFYKKGSFEEKRLNL